MVADIIEKQKTVASFGPNSDTLVLNNVLFLFFLVVSFKSVFKGTQIFVLQRGIGIGGDMRWNQELIRSLVLEISFPGCKIPLLLP